MTAEAKKTPKPKLIPGAYQPLGAALDLFLSTDTEVLISGPANTGKSVAVGHYILLLCERFPGIRVLVVRKTRTSLSDSFIPTFENRVLPPGHPMRGSDVDPSGRRRYKHPNGSQIVLGSMEKPTRHYSTEWDVVWYEEVTDPDTSLDEWERLLRSLRNKKIPHPLGPDPETGEPRYMHRLIGTCNPDGPQHWLLTREKTGKLRHLRSKHEDNPAFDKYDLEKLDAMTGVRLKRLRYGIWAGSEAAIWENFDIRSPGTHIVKDHPRDAFRAPAYTYTVVGVDWGFSHPGCMGVYGVDYDGRMYRAWEVCRRGWTIDDWIKRAVELNRQWKPIAFVCDSAEPGKIEQFQRAGLPAVAIQKTGTKSRDFIPLSLDMVRDRFKVQEDGLPRLMFVADAHDEADPFLKEQGKPYRVEDEIPQYSFEVDKRTNQVIEGTPAPNQWDHCIDAMRYACVYVERYNQVGARASGGEDHTPKIQPACKWDLTPNDGLEQAIIDGTFENPALGED